MASAACSLHKSVLMLTAQVAVNLFCTLFCIVDDAADYMLGFLHVVSLCTCASVGGEMPAASAAVIYFIRASVIRHLAEPGQRKLLAALARATSHAIAPPVIIAALEGCGVLLEILGG